VKGFFNKILRINLKTKTFKGKTIPGSIYEIYLGGKGLFAYLLMKENLNGVNPLSPVNKLIFSSGPITDTRIYGSSNFFLASSLGLNRIF
jgi:aldehyde:ferredoxin oxidoreductase